MQITIQHNIQVLYDYRTLVDEDKCLHEGYVYVCMLGITENKDIKLCRWDRTETVTRICR